MLKLFSDGDISASCKLINSIYSSSDYVNLTLVNRTIFYGETPLVPSATDCSIQDTNAAVTIFCEATDFTLTISTSVGGSTNPAPGSHSYFYKTEVQIEAIPNEDYKFNYWSGDVFFPQKYDNPITVIMNSDKDIKANFSRRSTGDGEIGKEGGCFIASAAHGSPFHPHVKILRDFRDKYLMSNELGREFVNLYYKYSPFVANLIERNRTLKILIQINLLPFVIFCYSTLHFGPIVTGIIFIFIFVLPIFLILFYWRRFRRTRA